MGDSRRLMRWRRSVWHCLSLPQLWRRMGRLQRRGSWRARPLCSPRARPPPPGHAACKESYVTRLHAKHLRMQLTVVDIAVGKPKAFPLFLRLTWGPAGGCVRELCCVHSPGGPCGRRQDAPALGQGRPCHPLLCLYLGRCELRHSPALEAATGSHSTQTSRGTTTHLPGAHPSSAVRAPPSSGRGHLRCPGGRWEM